MARKTYHHLNVGDRVVVERVCWDDESMDVTVLEQFTRGEVREVKTKTLRISTGSRPEDVLLFSKQGGQEWGSCLDGWRIAPAHGRVKGQTPKPYVAPKDLPIMVRMNRDFFEYPGQPLVCAAAIVATFSSPEEAAASDVESRGGIPGAGGQPTRAVKALLAFRKHKSVDRVIEDLHAAWRTSVGGGNYDEAYEPGMVKAQDLEPVLRNALAKWL